MCGPKACEAAGASHRAGDDLCAIGSALRLQRDGADPWAVPDHRVIFVQKAVHGRRQTAAHRHLVGGMDAALHVPQIVCAGHCKDTGTGGAGTAGKPP